MKMRQSLFCPLDFRGKLCYNKSGNRIASPFFNRLHILKVRAKALISGIVTTFEKRILKI